MGRKKNSDEVKTTTDVTKNKEPPVAESSVQKESAAAKNGRDMKPPDGGAGESQEKTSEKKKKGFFGKKKKERMPKRSFLSRFDAVNRFRHWWLGGVSITRSLFRVKAAQQTLLILIGIITAAYIMAAFYTQSGEFVVTLGREMADDGFVLSETSDFSEKRVTLHGSSVVGATNINITDISRDVMDVDGEHNGFDYVAYTFYLENKTGETRNYVYQLRLRSKSKGAEKATWIMLFKNNEMTVYADLAADGSPERQYSLAEFPFMDYAAPNVSYTQMSAIEGKELPVDKLTQLGIDNAEGLYRLQAQPFEANDMICSGLREGIEPEEIDKYTVVIWIEGEDPECTDEIIGGWLELAMTFSY